MARATVAGDGPRLVHILVLAVVGQARPSRAIPQDSCHVGLSLRLGRPCGSTHTSSNSCSLLFYIIGLCPMLAGIVAESIVHKTVGSHRLASQPCATGT